MADAQRFASGRERDAQRQQQRLRLRRKQEAITVAAAIRRELAQLRQLVEAEVVPQEGVRGVERDAVLLRKRERRGEVRNTARRFTAGSAQLRFPPLGAPAAGNERVVVLEELARRNQHFAHVNDFTDAGRDRLGLVAAGEADATAVVKQHQRPLDGIARRDRRRLTGELDFELGTDGREAVKRDHRRRIQRDRREARKPRAAVAQAEATRAVRERENWAANEHVPEVLVFARARLFLLLLGVRAQEIPAVNLEPLDMLEHFGRLEAEPLGNHQRRAAAQPVGLDARQVAVARHLEALGRLAGDADRTGAHNCVNLVARREVLQVDRALVERDFLLVALDLSRRGDVGVEPQLPSHDVRYQHRKRLRSATGGANRAGVINGGTAGRVVVLHRRDAHHPLGRCDQHAFGED